MALSEICGFDKYMQPNKTSVNALNEAMNSQCSNMANNYELALPPFTNVNIFVHCLLF